MNCNWPVLCLLVATSAVAAKLLSVPSAELWRHVNKSCRHLRSDSNSGIGDGVDEKTNCNAGINLQYLQQLEQYMRQDVDPCVDFYGYACGNWRAVHGNQESVMALSIQHINERYVQLFERLLDDRLAPEHHDLNYAKLLRYYESCRRNNLPGRLQLRGYLEQLSLPSSAPNWLELLARLGRYGYSKHFLQMSIIQRNATQHNIYIVPHNAQVPGLNLTQQLYETLPTQTSLSTLRLEFAKLEADLADIVRLTAEHSNDETMRYYSLGQLMRECGELDWQQALSMLFSAGQTLPSTHLLLVDELPVIKKLAQYLNNADPTLLMLYTLANFLNYLLELPHNPLSSAKSSSSLSCVRHMRKTLYLPMNYVYEQSYYAPQRAEDEHVINGVFAELKQQFARTLSTNEMGLSFELMQVMQSKLEGVRLNLGNMPHNASAQFYEQWVQHLPVGENFYANHLQTLLHYHAHLAQLERTGAGHPLWYSFNQHGPLLTDNIDATPYFYVLGNIITIPYAYLQLPFYNAHFWPALLHGDLANTLGHELLHVFDTDFVDYDVHGNMRDYGSLLMNNQRYVANVNCLNDSSVVVLNERLADVSGTRLALNTYMKRAEHRRHNGKLYFLQFAQFFCGDDSDDYHEPGSKRLNYTLAQMPEFAEVFGCMRGAPMNPAKRCRYW